MAKKAIIFISKFYSTKQALTKPFSTLPNLSAQFDRADPGQQGLFQIEFSPEPKALEYVLASRKAAVEAGIERDCGEGIVAKVYCDDFNSVSEAGKKRALDLG